MFLEVDQLKQRNIMLETEIIRLEQQNKVIAANADREKSFIQSSYETRLNAVIMEKNEIANKAQSELVARIKDISEEYNQRIEELQVNIYSKI